MLTIFVPTTLLSFLSFHMSFISIEQLHFPLSFIYLFFFLFIYSFSSHFFSFLSSQTTQPKGFSVYISFPFVYFSHNMRKYILVGYLKPTRNVILLYLSFFFNFFFLSLFFLFHLIYQFLFISFFI